MVFCGLRFVSFSCGATFGFTDTAVWCIPKGTPPKNVYVSFWLAIGTTVPKVPRGPEGSWIVRKNLYQVGNFIENILPLRLLVPSKGTSPAEHYGPYLCSAASDHGRAVNTKLIRTPFLESCCSFAKKDGRSAGCVGDVRRTRVEVSSGDLNALCSA